MIDTASDPGPIGETPALLVVDPQLDFVDPSGATFCGADSVDGIGDVLANINRVVAVARDRDVPIIWSKERHRPDGADAGLERLSTADHTVEGTPGEGFSDDLDVDADDLPPAEYIVQKRRYDLFFGTDLEHILKTYGIDTVLITGVTTNVCVHYTAHGAHQRDYLFRVIEECTAAASSDVHEAGLTLCDYLLPRGVESIDQVTTGLDQYDGNPVVRRVKETGRVG